MIISFCVITINSAFALSDYQCEIQRVVGADPENTSALTFHEQYQLGKKFTVERSTGLMAGALKNSYVTKPQVIDWGSDQNSFKVVTIMRQEQGIGFSSNVYLLTIKEYSPSTKKPFIFVENDVVFLGTCEHF